MLRHLNNKRSSSSPKTNFLNKKGREERPRPHSLPAPQASAPAAPWDSSGEPGGRGGSDSSAVGSREGSSLDNTWKGRSLLLPETGPNPWPTPSSECQ